MSKIISIHSFRRGTGKTNITANVAALLVAKALRVGVVDTDLWSPGIHVPFSLDENKLTYTFNDYLQGNCNIEQTVYEITWDLRREDKQTSAGSGKLFLAPSSTSSKDIKRALRENYDVELFERGFSRLIETLNLDVLVLDTHAGLSEETLAAISVSDALVVILRPDQQDYQGTSVLLEVAQKLNIPRVLLVVNQVVPAFDSATIKKQIEQTYHCEVAEVLSYSEDMIVLASAGLFVLRHPDHSLTTALKRLMENLIA